MIQKPIINSVEIKKTGRYWTVSTDKHKPAAIVLYKRGALALQALLEQLAGICQADLTKASNPTKPAKKTKGTGTKIPPKKASAAPKTIPCETTVTENPSTLVVPAN